MNKLFAFKFLSVETSFIPHFTDDYYERIIQFLSSVKEEDHMIFTLWLSQTVITDHIEI